MKILSKNESISAPSAVALGLFDGIHLGHRAVIGRAVQYQKNGLIPAVFTFSTGSVTHKHGKELYFIFDNNSKLDILSSLGVDFVCSPNFDEMKNMPAEDFALNIIKKRLNAKKVVCGHNFHFGRGGVCGLEELLALGNKYGFSVDAIDRVMCDGKPVSSAAVREFLKTGQIELANMFLGINYFLELPVSYGKQIGRTINFPTINQHFFQRSLIPKYGVYVSQTTVNDTIFRSVTNIGIKPTVHSNKIPLAETHIMDCSENLYGQTVKVELLSFLRGERKFQNIDQLKNAIAFDIKAAKDYSKT